ncbi:MAG: hypothetical protein IT258_23500, partial [Saprospiraceae bacterium]|nr:hypothetical protein [Saprospiraceae bacterium]
MKLKLLIGLLMSVLSLSAQSGIQFKLQLLPDGQYWGVFAKPSDDLYPSQNTMTGTGQVTIVMPLNYAWSNLTSVNGNWGSISTVHGPAENPGKSYVSIQFLTDTPTIKYQHGQATLLFKFKKANDCPDQLYLMNHNNDPFIPPNSVNSNPGNDITVFDFGNGLALYGYASNYAPAAWDCRDNDGDGVLNAHV